MKVSREKLLDELISVRPGLSQREVIEQSSCVIFQDGRILTYNEEVACSRKSCLNIKGAVIAEPLISILMKLKEDDIEVEVKGEELLLKAGKKKRAGIRMEAEILLATESLEKPKKWKKLPDDFGDAVHLVSRCAGKDASEFVMMCVHLHPKWIEACDNYQAGRYRIAIGIKKSFLIRAESLSLVESLNVTKFSQTKNWVHFKNPDGLVLSFQKYLDEYPKISRIVKIQGDPLTLPKGIKDSVERAQIFSMDNADDKKVHVRLKGKVLRLKAEGASGWYEEPLKISYKGNKMSCRIDPNLLVALAERNSKCTVDQTRMMARTAKFKYITVLDEA